MTSETEVNNTKSHVLADTARDDLLLRVLRPTGRYSGAEFFDSLTQTLAHVTQVKIAFVCELLLEADMARQVAICIDGERGESIEYSLEGAPCKEAVERGSAVFEDAVALRFPDDAWLREVGAESYAAVLLSAASGDPLGILGVVHSGPIGSGDLVISVLQDLAPRVSAELERRQVETALRRSEARFRLLVEHSKDAMFYYNVLRGSFEYASPATSEVLGLPPEAIEANPDNAIDLIHDEDRPLVLRAISSGTEEPITARIRQPGGEMRWVEYRNFALKDGAGQVVGIGGSIRDISTRLEAEDTVRLNQRYTRTLLEAIPDTVIRINAAGIVLDFVPGEVFAEHASPEAVVGMPAREMLPPAFFPQAQRLVQTALRSGRSQRLEFEIREGGESRHYEARCVPFGDEEALLIFRDFTAMKWHEGEEERRRLRDEIDNKVEQHIRTNPYGLTYRELAILHLVADGSADKQIAESLGISIYTVNKHVGNILGKMGAASRTEAGVRAIREGLLG